MTIPDALEYGLDDPGRIGAFLSQVEADDAYCRCLSEIDWKKLTRNKGKPQSRLTLNYDLKMRQARPIVILEELIQQIEFVFQTVVRGVYCNLYRDGRDFTPYHQASFGDHFFSISLGATRKFNLKRVKTKRVREFTLEHGDVFYLSPRVDALCAHSVPRTPWIKEERVSVVFYCSQPFTVDTYYCSGR